MKHSKVIGSILILIGTCIGAGILALPIISAASGFIMSSILMVGMWVLMTLTAILILEVNLACPENTNSFGVMALSTLGKRGQIITWAVFLLLLYSLLAAYTSGATSLFKNMVFSKLDINLPTWSCAMLFICTLGGVVFWSTGAVDYTNRFLITGKMLLLISCITLLLSHINLTNVYYTQEINANKYLGVAAPIFLCAFGFHVVIPSLRNYVGNNRKKLQLIIFIGTSTVLVIYLLWLLAILGSISPRTFNINDNSVEGLIHAISIVVDDKAITTSINTFSSISMATSFLGVALAIFDFLADGFNLSNTRYGRLQTALLTFIPPLVFALYYPKGFMMALGYASIFVAILLVILPAMMAYKLRQKTDNKILFNKFLLIGVILIGFALIVLQISVSSGLLATTL